MVGPWPVQQNLFFCFMGQKASKVYPNDLDHSVSCETQHIESIPGIVAIPDITHSWTLPYMLEIGRAYGHFFVLAALAYQHCFGQLLLVPPGIHQIC